MGKIYADIELVKVDDLEKVELGLLAPDQVRQLKLHIRIDLHSLRLCINEQLQAYFQFRVRGKRTFQSNNGLQLKCDIVGPVEIRFQNRDTICDAIVLPGDAAPSMGMVPMEAMDVQINRQELIVNPQHPDVAVLSF
jgi:hypothetical protein